ncbi:hypothetical protein PLESTB_000522800 [Pleodorina starrii]|uniref:Uncharacterized protein n=1 Tax=Pleodorina starrii TaxID=330485 RepID=A0A9W6BG68_9CHLO|nr:hypothetical protein PLESTB_000522800 [Pleodorina starrii]
MTSAEATTAVPTSIASAGGAGAGPPTTSPRLPTIWPRASHLRDMDTGWVSGTTEPGVEDGAPPEWGYTYCSCTNYTVDSYRFEGVCAVLSNDTYEYYSYGSGGSQCVVTDDCAQPPSEVNGERLDTCSSVYSCTAYLDTELEGTYCNIWNWCSDPQGCPGLDEFRACVLKTGDPENPTPLKGYGNSTGWMSGVRMAWMSGGAAPSVEIVSEETNASTVSAGSLRGLRGLLAA